MPARLLILLVAAAVPLLDVVFAAPLQPKPRKVAFLVGVGKYDHKFSDLGTAPENDVSELAKTLKDSFEVVTLTGSKPDNDPNRATKSNIESRFKELLKGGNGKPPIRDGDTVLVVLCGHGVQEQALDPTTGKKEEQPFFCPVDARPDDTDTMVPLNGLIRASESFGGTSLFLVDACREVPPDANRTRSGIQGKKVNLPAKTAVLFACAAGQLSHQSDKAGPGHGLFTFAVLKTLNGGGRVTWGRLVDDVQAAFQGDELKALLPDGKTQSPVLATGELGFTELLVNPKAAAPVSATPAVSEPPGTVAKLADGNRAEEYQYVVNDTTRRKTTRHILTLDLGDGAKMEFVRVRAGEFSMGAPDGEKEAKDEEKPQRKLKMSTFYLGIFEVTQAQYKAVTGKTPSRFKGDRLPVEQVSWDDAVAFCEAASKTTGRKLSLPTEAQWEYACRAGTTTPFHFGTALCGDRANHNGEFPYGTADPGKRLLKTTDVGSYEPNPWGFHDMHGNVYEWCQDAFGEYQKLATTDPVALGLPGSNRVVRGGSYLDAGASCRAAFRHKIGPGATVSIIGFRVCLHLN